MTANLGDSDLGSRRTDLMLPLDLVAETIGELNRSYVGVRPIPVQAIVGTTDRSVADFDRQFNPKQSHLLRRLRNVRARFPDGDFPPIQVVELGGVYFVIDGHHRVALARELGMEFVDAEIVSVTTHYAVPIDIDTATLIHTDAQRRFHRDSGLGQVTSSPLVQFSRPQGYPELLEVIRAWGYEQSLAAGTLIPPDEVARRWVEEVFRPGVEALKDVELPAAYRYKTEADLFLWVHQLLRAMLTDQSKDSYAEAASQARRPRVSRRFRRRFLRERSAPLTPKL